MPGCWWCIELMKQPPRLKSYSWTGVSSAPIRTPSNGPCTRACMRRLSAGSASTVATDEIRWGGNGHSTARGPTVQLSSKLRAALAANVFPLICSY